MRWGILGNRFRSASTKQWEPGAAFPVESLESSSALHDAPRADAVTGSARVAMRTALLASALALQANVASLKAATIEQLPVQPAATNAGAAGGVRALRLAAPWRRAGIRTGEELPVASPTLVQEIAPIPRPLGRWSWVVPRSTPSAEELPIPPAAGPLEETARPIVVPRWPVFARARTVVLEELPIEAAPSGSAGASGGVRALRLPAAWRRPPQRPAEELPSVAVPTVLVEASGPRPPVVMGFRSSWWRAPSRVAEELPSAAAPSIIFEAGPASRRQVGWPEWTIVVLTGGGDDLALPLVHEVAPTVRPPRPSPWRRPPLVRFAEELPVAASPTVLSEAPALRPPAVAGFRARTAPRGLRVAEELPIAPVVPLEDVARRRRQPVAIPWRTTTLRVVEELPRAVLLEYAAPSRIPGTSWTRRLPAVRGEELPVAPVAPPAILAGASIAPVTRPVPFVLWTQPPKIAAEELPGGPRPGVVIRFTLELGPTLQVPVAVAPRILVPAPHLSPVLLMPSLSTDEIALKTDTLVRLRPVKVFDPTTGTRILATGLTLTAHIALTPTGAAVDGTLSLTLAERAPGDFHGTFQGSDAETHLRAQLGELVYLVITSGPGDFLGHHKMRVVDGVRLGA